MQWLQAMQHALQSSAYQGTVIYAGASQIDTLQVFHAMFDGVEYEHILSLDLSPREVIREQSKIFCFNQQQRNGRVSVVMPHKNFLGLPSGLDSAESYYTVQLGNQQKVVQRSAQIVSILPKDNLRYQHKFWIDQVSSIPVKIQLIDNTGNVLEQLMFADLKTGQMIPRDQFLLPVESKQYQWVTQKSEIVPYEQQKWRVVDKPAGFEIVNYMQEHNTLRSKRLTHLLLSDGIALVSVYVDGKAKTNEPSIELHRVGAMNLAKSIRSGYNLTIVGEVPQQTIRLIHNAMKIVH